MPTTDIATFPTLNPLEAVAEKQAVLVGGTVGQGFLCNQGDVLGLITSSGLYRRRTRQAATGAGFAANSTVGHVADNTVFAAGDALTTSGGVAIGTIAAGGIDLIDTTKVTLTANAANAVAAGVDVICTDGSAVAQGISNAGADGTVNASLPIFVSGLLKSANIRGLTASAMAEMSGAILAGNIFKF